MDYFIIVVTTAAGLYFHWWIYWRIRRWMDRDLALSFAGDDPQSVTICYSDWPRPRPAR